MISMIVEDTLASIQAQGRAYGRSDAYKGQSVLLEFVSANPHAPITVDNGRGGVLGDVLSKLLEAVGYEVTREYYVNDVLNTVQMENLSRSVEVRYLQALGHDIQLPDDGYQGDHVTEIARKIVGQDGDKHVHLPRHERMKLFIETAKREMLALQKTDMDALGVSFDNWYYESNLFSSKVDEALDELEKRGYAYKRAGALWLKSAAFGDEVDRPLIRDNGLATYIASDVAYHKDKFDRGFDRLINIWGPQHEAYVPRTRAAVESLGYEPERLEVLIHSDVKLFSGGEQVMMAKRRGEFVALSKLIDEVGRDATRFFLLLQKAEEPLDFDLDLARTKTNENPMHAAQKAHRLASVILRSGEQDGIKVASLKGVDTSALSTPAERALVEKLARYPDVVQEAAEQREPYRIACYAGELAALFHTFYADTPVSGAEKSLQKARLFLTDAARTVLENTMEIIGVSASDGQ